MISGDGCGLRFPIFVLQLRKNINQENCRDQELNRGPVGGRQRRHPSTTAVVYIVEKKKKKSCWDICKRTQIGLSNLDEIGQFVEGLPKATVTPSGTHFLKTSFFRMCENIESKFIKNRSNFLTIAIIHGHLYTRPPHYKYDNIVWGPRHD